MNVDDHDSADQLLRLATDDTAIHQDAAEWFVRQGAAAAPVLVRGLDNDRLGFVCQWRILLVLRRLALPDTLPAIIGAFRRALATNNPIVLPGALEALAAFDTNEAMSALIAALDSANPNTVNHAAGLLADKGGCRVENALSALLDRDVVAVRDTGVRALLSLGTGSARETLRRHRAREQDPSVLKLLAGL
jgi:HEAT repeat protein